MNNKIINIAQQKLKKETGIELFSFQQIKELGITFTKDDQLVSGAVLSMIYRIEDPEENFIPLNIVLKRQGNKIIVIEGKHAIQAINLVHKHSKNWYDKVIPVMFYVSGEIL